MPITEDERGLFYELFDIPNDTSVLNIDGQFAAGRKQVDYAITTAKSEIDAKLDALTGAPLTRMQEILARYREISFQTHRVEAMGSNEGVNVDPRRERARLRRLARTIVPVLVAGHDGMGGGIPLG